MYKHCCPECDGISYSAVSPDEEKAMPCPHCQPSSEVIACPECNTLFPSELVSAYRREIDNLNEEFTRLYGELAVLKMRVSA